MPPRLAPRLIARYSVSLFRPSNRIASATEYRPLSSTSGGELVILLQFLDFPYYRYPSNEDNRSVEQVDIDTYFLWCHFFSRLSVTL